MIHVIGSPFKDCFYCDMKGCSQRPALPGENCYILEYRRMCASSLQQDKNDPETINCRLRPTQWTGPRKFILRVRIQCPEDLREQRMEVVQASRQLQELSTQGQAQQKGTFREKAAGCGIGRHWSPQHSQGAD